MFAVMKTFVTVISAYTGRNDFIFDIWRLVPCLPFPGLPHIYFLFTVRLTNERVGVFLARRSLQHLVVIIFSFPLGVVLEDKICNKEEYGCNENERIMGSLKRNKNIKTFVIYPTVFAMSSVMITNILQ
jgi:hypothetical protein